MFQEVECRLLIFKWSHKYKSRGFKSEKCGGHSLALLNEMNCLPKLCSSQANTLQAVYRLAPSCDTRVPLCHYHIFVEGPARISSVTVSEAVTLDSHNVSWFIFKKERPDDLNRTHCRPRCNLFLFCVKFFSRYKSSGFSLLQKW